MIEEHTSKDVALPMRLLTSGPAERNRMPAHISVLLAGGAASICKKRIMLLLAWEGLAWHIIKCGGVAGLERLLDVGLVVRAIINSADVITPVPTRGPEGALEAHINDSGWKRIGTEIKVRQICQCLR